VRQVFKSQIRGIKQVNVIKKVKKAAGAVITVIITVTVMAFSVFASGGGAAVIQNGFATLLDIVKALNSCRTMYRNAETWVWNQSRK